MEALIDKRNYVKFEKNLSKYINKKIHMLLITGNYIPVKVGNPVQRKKGKNYIIHKYKVECICDCGNTVYLFWGGLIGGQTKSCGCLQKLKAAETFQKYRKSNPHPRKIDTEKRLLNKHYGSYRARANKYNKEFELSKEQFQSLVYSSCHYCNRKPELNFSSLLVSKSFNGIDRKDNNLGYTLANSLPCCMECNFFKRDYEYSTFLNLINMISKNRGKDFVENKEQKSQRISLYEGKNKKFRKTSEDIN